jgi:hypothetical protein
MGRYSLEHGEAGKRHQSQSKVNPTERADRDDVTKSPNQEPDLRGRT